MKKNKNVIIVNAIQSTRSKNNNNWMDLLKLSLEYAPIEAKKILKRINKQDKKISYLLQKLSK
jgi:hypothetical protein|tara:strand:- start:1848 stop:2036 length:189 start_codon:yes stop_codon:yes gene_type:complete